MFFWIEQVLQTQFGTIAAQYIADIHNICSDSNLPNEMTPLQYQQGVTPDISVYLQFTFWQPILYLDHESSWPESKERSARWVGVAHGIGDALTFWILDDQSKQVLARSVVQPFHQNHRVKWDPELADIQGKSTAVHGGDIMPTEVTEDIDILEDQDEQLEVTVPPSLSNTPNDQSVLKPEYENPGLDTTCLAVPKDMEIRTRSKGKLKLDSTQLPLDDTIKTYVGTKIGKKSYKDVKYKNSITPDPVITMEESHVNNKDNLKICQIERKIY